MLEIEQLVVDGDHDGQDHDPKGVDQVDREQAQRGEPELVAQRAGVGDQEDEEHGEERHAVAGVAHPEVRTALDADGAVVLAVGFG